ncbi:MAG: hypothetical protein WCR42_02245 [bacterium]
MQKKSDSNKYKYYFIAKVYKILHKIENKANKDGRMALNDNFYVRSAFRIAKNMIILL